MNFSGVHEPGKFGGTLMTSYFSRAETLYDQILAHPECTDEERAFNIFRKGTSALFSARISRTDRTEEVIELWLQGRAMKGPAALLCTHALADLYWTLREYEKAVELAKEACDTYPYSHLTLYQAYKEGKGVEKDPAAASHHWSLWQENA
jgi:lipopolysaccharide biosynthesis regulator YciM